MDATKPSDKEPAWLKCDTWDRSVSCRTMLHMTGLITDIENKRIIERMKKWALKHEPATVFEK